MHAQITLHACKNPKPPKSLGSHRRFRVRNLLCESRSPGPVYIGEIRRCRFDVSGPCAQLLSGSHRRFRVRNLLCDAPRFSETAVPRGSHRRFRVLNLLCGAPRFSETATPFGSHSRRFPVGNLLCDAPRFSETAAPLGSHRRFPGGNPLWWAKHTHTV